MSLFLEDFNGVVRFFPKFFFHLVASFGHCGVGAGQSDLDATWTDLLTRPTLLLCTTLILDCELKDMIPNRIFHHMEFID